MQSQLGLVKWFDSSKGFGVIGTPNKNEYFFRIEDVLPASKLHIKQGAAINFVPKEDNKKKRFNATKCRHLSTYDDWKSILEYLDKNSIVQIEVDVRRGRGLGTYYAGKTLKSFSLKGSGAIQIFNRISLETIESYIINFFNEDLKPENFYSFCKFVEEHLAKAELKEGYKTKGYGLFLKEKIFKHFECNANDAILFQVWKHKCPQYISKSIRESLALKKNKFTENKEYISFNGLDISKSSFTNNIEQIGFAELKRIYEYDFGKSFCLNFLEERFTGYEDLSTIETRNYIQLLYLLNDSGKQSTIDKIQPIYIDKALNQIRISANKVGKIGDFDFEAIEQLYNLKGTYSTGFNSIIDDAVECEVERIIHKNATDGYLLEAWLDGKVKTLSFEKIQKAFQSKNSSRSDSHTRNRILSKLTVKEQLALLESCVKNTSNGWGTSFTFLQDYLRWLNRVTSETEALLSQLYAPKSEVKVYKEEDYTNNDLNTKLYDKDFWCKRKGYDLLSEFNALIDSNATDDEKVTLIKDGFISYLAVPFSCIETFFIRSTNNYDRVRLLSAIPLEEQLRLLIALKENSGWQATIAVFEEYFTSINPSIHYTFSLKSIASSTTKGYRGEELLISIKELVNNPLPEKEMLELHLLGIKERFTCSYEIVKAEFFKRENPVKAKLLSLLAVNEQLELLILYRNENDWKSTFHLLESYLKKGYNGGKELKDALINFVKNSASEYEKLELYLDDLICFDNLPLELVKSRFIKTDSETVKIKLLNALPKDEQVKLLINQKERHGWEDTLEILGKYINHVNKYRIDFKTKLFDTDFWLKQEGGQLVLSFNEVLDKLATASEKYELYLQGFYKNLSKEIILENALSFSEGQCVFTFNQFSNEKELIYAVLERRLINAVESDLIWLCNIAKEYLDEGYLKELHLKIHKVTPSSDYIKLWQDGLVSIFPEQHINTLLEQDSFITIAKKWLKDDIKKRQPICHIILKYLQDERPITDQVIFSRHSNFIKFLLEVDIIYAANVQKIGNELYSLILWLHTSSDYSDFNFDVLKVKFIYFNPIEQAKIIRKLFWLKSTGKFDLTVNKLKELTRFDLDLYKTNLQFNPRSAVDLSTEVIIQALDSYTRTGKFLTEGELLSIVLKHVENDKSRHVKADELKLQEYFEACAGRMTDEFNWERNGEIKKIYYGEDKYYYAITFGYNEEILNKVKLLPSRKWNSEAQHWGVPAKYQSEVMQFVKDNRFFIHESKNPYADNIHLAEFKRKEVPNGITFCEGRKANTPHYLYKQDFWFCAGQPCFQKCETIHSAEAWNQYSLLDFCEILELNTDEINHMNDFISKGKYYQFIGLVNRFNRLIEKLYCHACEEILHPIQHGHFTVNNVVRFSCQNTKCAQLDKEIYLNHCLNGQCNSVIDSRVSNKCSHELFICDQCGSCCSHSMFERRLRNLELVGGYVHAELRHNVNYKTGHLERAEYFCHKCSNEMVETSADVFVCNNCENKYDTTKFKIKRPHKQLPKFNPPY